MPNIVTKGLRTIRLLITKGYKSSGISLFVKFCDVYDTANIGQLLSSTHFVSQILSTESFTIQELSTESGL